ARHRERSEDRLDARIDPRVGCDACDGLCHSSWIPIVVDWYLKHLHPRLRLGGYVFPVVGHRADAYPYRKRRDRGRSSSDDYDFTMEEQILVGLAAYRWAAW